MAAHADMVVSLDGHYKSISEALTHVPLRSNKRYTMYVKRGVYKEKETIVVSKETWNLTIVGDGIDATIVSGSRSNGDGLGTDKTPTMTVNGQGFILRDMTVENTAGPGKNQAVAFLSTSDKSVVHRCCFRGFQDTLWAQEHRQLYIECRIEGTVDFIFGAATAVFQNCEIVARRPIHGQSNTITAQGREDARDSNGFVFQFCNILSSEDLAGVETYLGRPWRPFARVIFMESNLSKIITPKGWLEFEGSPNVNRLFYGEYKNSGPGSDTTGRVNWGGVHLITQAADAEEFTVRRFIDGDEWLPATGVHYKSGL